MFSATRLFTIDVTELKTWRLKRPAPDLALLPTGPVLSEGQDVDLQLDRCRAEPPLEGVRVAVTRKRRRGDVIDVALEETEAVRRINAKLANQTVTLDFGG